MIPCPACNSKTKKHTGTYHYTESGLDNVFIKGVMIHICACGEEFPELPEIINLQSTIGNHLIRQKKPLNGQEIRFLRKNMGLSGKKLAEWMGVENETVSRWETGKLKISSTNDRFLRLIYANTKRICADQIQEMVKELFHQIKDSQRRPAPIHIPRKDWSSQQAAPIRVAADC